MPPTPDDVMTTNVDQGISLKVRTAFLALLVLPALIYLLVQAILSGMLYLNQYRLDMTLDHWSQKKSAISLAQWHATEEVVLALLAEHNKDASVVNAAGRVYAYRITHLISNRKDRLVYGNKALSYYRTTTSLRPAWSYGWMNFAIAKARMGRVDAAFKQSLLQVLHLDPWGKKTLPVIIQLSLFAWPYLDKPDRQALLDYFVVAQESRKADVQKVLNKSNRMKLYCLLLTQHGSKASFCP